MNTQELRLGNYIYVNNNKVKRRTQIIAITKGGIAEEGGLTLTNNPNYPYNFKMIGKSDIEPIPLAEEHLLSCGFEEQIYEKDELPCFYKNGFCISCDSFAKERFIYQTDLEIRHLHQLQNIYFDLTGEELEFDL